MNDRIIFENVSKFYGEVLGVNRISLSIPPGITTLVGPNGSGKTTLMNLMTGLVQPSRGQHFRPWAYSVQCDGILQCRWILHSVRFLSPRNHWMGFCLR